MNGEKLALQQAGGRVGGFTVKYVALDDATPEAGRWDPDATLVAARKATQDKSAIAYLGDLDSGASAISLPVLNDAGILQISPSSTYIGLTRAEGADKGEPDKYYPTGRRTFGRVVPADQIQAAAQIAYQQAAGCTKLYILNDRDVYGQGIALAVQRDAVAKGMQVLANDPLDRTAKDFRDVAQKIRAARANCVFFGGSVDNRATEVWAAVHAANPTAKLFGADGVAVSSFTSKLSPSAQRVTYITSPALDPESYPPKAQRFFQQYRATFGRAPEPDAIYGYEAMSLVIQCIKDAGTRGNDRQAVIDAFFKIKNRDSILGTYSIDSDGDTTLTDYGAYRVAGGKLVFDKLIKPEQG